jgi:hypothetical protein
MPFTMRRAQQEDSYTLAALFQMVYQNSSHPFETVAGISEFLAEPRNFQIVAERGGSVVASMAMTYSSWNDSYELGRALTHPQYRRHGLAACLLQQVVDLVAEQWLGELIFGFPRVRRIADLCADLDPQMVATGHDAGRNVANGSRETHLIIFGIPTYARFCHVSPPVREVLAWPFLSERIYASLGLHACPGAYPESDFIGPRSQGARGIGDWIIEYSEPSGALTILGRRSTLDPWRISAELESLLAFWPQAQHIAATVLADKISLIHALVECGFELAAYLPAWLKLGRFRYDCVQLAWRRYTGCACTQDLGETLRGLETTLRESPYQQQLKQLKCSARASDL